MPLIIVEFPEDCKQLAEAVRAAVALVDKTRAEAAGGAAVDDGAVEAALAEASAAVERASHHAALSALEVDRAAITVEGHRYNRVGRHPWKCSNNRQFSAFAA